MMELPQEMRALLVERLDDYISDLTDHSDIEAIALSIIAAIEAAAVDADYEKSGEVVSRLEASGELEASLAEILEETLSADEEFDYTGEDLVAIVEKMCEIEWADLDDDGDDLSKDFFDDDAGDDDY